MPLTDADYDAALVHFGRKGMKWGEHVYGDEPASGKKVRTPAEQELHDSRVKSAALGGGAAAAVTILTAGIGLPVAAAIGAGTYFVARRHVYPVSSLSEHEAAGKATVGEIVKKH